MLKKIFCATALVAALIVCQAVAQDITQAPKPAISDYVRVQGAAPSSVRVPFAQTPGIAAPPANCSPCLFYGGDIDPGAAGANGLASETDLIVFGDPYGAAVFSPFVIGKHFKHQPGHGKHWSVTGLFANTLSIFGTLDPATCFWSINTGVAEGSGGTVVASGTDACTSTPTGRSAFGLTEFTVQVSGLTTIPLLGKGTYWMAVVPNCTNVNDGNCVDRFFESDAQTGLNAFGTPELVDQSFFDSSFFGFVFGNTTGVCGAGNGCDKFSDGVIGTVVH
jgi:hypothetical protein